MLRPPFSTPEFAGTFTASTEVGKILYRQSADTIKKLTLELGGNAPLIVFDDADLAQAIAGTMASKFRNAGQTCVCANRILVQSGIYDGFVAGLHEATAKLHVAPGRDPKSTIGPLINADAIEKVKALLADALVHGAKIETGGMSHRDCQQYALRSRRLSLQPEPVASLARRRGSRSRHGRRQRRHVLE